MKKNKGFTLIEVLIAGAIMISFMAAYLGTYQVLLNSSQQSKAFYLAYTAALSKMQEICAHDFGSITTDYASGHTPGNTWTVLDAFGNKMGKGVITISSSSGAATWTTATTSANWSVRYAFSSLVYDNKMWVIGGYDSTPNLKHDVWYTNDTNLSDGQTWTLVTASPGWIARESHRSLVYDNEMWLMGGYNGSLKNDVWYSNDGTNWYQAKPDDNNGWSKRGNFASLVYDNKMWVMGGWNGSTYLNDVWYSTDGINWTQALTSAPPNHWSPRYAQALVYDNKMWIIGGGGGSNDFNDVWYTNDINLSDGQTWTLATASANWSVRYGHTSLVYDNKMWVIGGVGEYGCYNDVWYSTDGINWTRDNSNDTNGWDKRKGHASLVYNNKMWVIGGYNCSSPKNDVWYSTGGGQLLDVTINVSFKTENGRIIGGDTNLNGITDGSETRLDSPVQIKFLVAEKKHEIFLGRPQ